MTLSKVRGELRDAARVDVLADVALADHTWFRIGGPAALFARAESAGELARLVAAARGLRVPVLVLGGGTNLLVSDDGFDGLVVHTAMARLEIDRERRLIHAGAAAESAELVDRAVEEGWEGLEFAAGLPGSVGGALAGNAGCFGRSFGQALVRATIVGPDGELRQVDDPAWFRFRYRDSRIRAGGVAIVEATLRCRKGDRGALRTEVDRNLALRAERHPPRGTRTAGSYFRNVAPLVAGEPYTAAGALLDRVGAKRMSVGDAAVFERHANIVINRGRASARDVLDLTSAMAGRVRERFGLSLVPEVRFVGPVPELCHERVRIAG